METQVRRGIPGDQQESSFMNATLQSAQGARGIVEFSIATHVNTPEGLTTEDDVADYLEATFTDLAVLAKNNGHDIAFEIEIGPGPDAEDNDG